eukprot:6288325-Amphidinium_carterae.1
MVFFAAQESEKGKPKGKRELRAWPSDEAGAPERKNPAVGDADADGGLDGDGAVRKPGNSKMAWIPVPADAVADVGAAPAACTLVAKDEIGAVPPSPNSQLETTLVLLAAFRRLLSVACLRLRVRGL